VVKRSRRTSVLTDKATAELREEIVSGRLSFGAALPSEGQLCRRFDVSRVTVRRALACLKAERLIESRAGVGHFVARRTARRAPGVASSRSEILYVHDMGRSGASLAPLGAAIFSGAAEEAVQDGLDLFLCCLDAAGLRRLVLRRKAGALRGVLFDWNDPAVARFLLNEGVPFAVVEGDFDDLPVAAVVQDDVGGTLAALGGLAALGHRRIAYLGPDDGWVHSRRRMAGYRQFHLERGWPVEESLIAFPADSESDGRAAAEHLLAAETRPTAVYVADRRFIPGLLAALAERKLAVPADLGVAVWGDPDPGAPGAEFTRVSWDRAEMGRLAVRLLNDRAEGGPTGRMQVLVPARLVEGSSTAAPKVAEG
jgi:GntR family transcriptional regulator of arabinose operon